MKIKLPRFFKTRYIIRWSHNPDLAMDNCLMYHHLFRALYAMYETHYIIKKHF